MNDPHDTDLAWRFIRGFDVPALTDEICSEWRHLIDRLTVDQFQAGCRKSRTRPANQLHLRPSIEAFKGYAGYAGPAAPNYETPANPLDPDAEIHKLARAPYEKFDPRELPTIAHARLMLDQAPAKLKEIEDRHRGSRNVSAKVNEAEAS